MEDAAEELEFEHGDKGLKWKITLQIDAQN